KTAIPAKPAKASECPICAAMPVLPGYRAALLQCRRCRRKHTLHENQVEPAPELESHLVEMADGREPKAAVQADGRRVVRIDAGNHHMLAHVGGAPQELSDQGPAQSLAAPVRAHVHAMLDAVPVARPCAKLAEAAESHDARSVPRHDDRETKPHLGVEPCLAASRGEFLLGVNGRRMADDLVVD